MNKKQSKHGLARVWPALGAVAIVAAGLTGVPGARAAEPTPTAGTNSDAHVVLDNNSLWRHFLVTRCAYAPGDDGKLAPWDIAPLGRNGNWTLWVAPAPAATTAPSPLPPADWAGPDMDDSAWPRVRLPQPTRTVSAAYYTRPQRREGGTAALLVSYGYPPVRFVPVLHHEMAAGGAIDSPGGKIPGEAPGSRPPRGQPTSAAAARRRARSPFASAVLPPYRAQRGPATLRESNNKTVFRNLLDTRFPVGVQD